MKKSKQDLLQERQQAVLRFLEKRPGRSMTEIALRLNTAPSTASSIVRRMQSDGLVSASGEKARRYSAVAPEDRPTITTRPPKAPRITPNQRSAAAHTSIIESARQHGGLFGILVAQITK